MHGTLPGMQCYTDFEIGLELAKIKAEDQENEALRNGVCIPDEDLYVANSSNWRNSADSVGVR